MYPSTQKRRICIITSTPKQESYVQNINLKLYKDGDYVLRSYKNYITISDLNHWKDD